MSEALNEQLSALVDDELDGSELPLLMRQLAGSETLTERLERYYLIGDAMRGELPADGPSGLADRVGAAVEAEPAHRARRWPRLPGQALRPAAGLAIAASVAVLAVSLWPGGPASTPQPESFSTTANIATVNPQSGTMRVSTGSGGGTGTSVAAGPEQEWERLDPRVQHWLNGYIVDHSEHAGSAQLGGMMNYARIAGQQPKSQ